MSLRTSCTAAVLLTATALTAPAFAGPAGRGESDQDRGAEHRHGDSGGSSAQSVIRWDAYGVPHIYGPDILTVVRGLGYATMENHAELVLNNAARARGRYAEYFGPGAGNANVAGDIQIRTLGVPARAAQWVAQGGQEQAQIVQAFADGVNEYAQAHASTIDPVLQKILPFVPSDVTAGIQNTVYLNIMAGQQDVYTLIGDWQAGGLAAANAFARSVTPTGSNGWAVAPSRSADGNAILMGNPHLPWGVNQLLPGLGVYQFFESQLVVGDPDAPALNITGATFPGAPFIGIGFNDELGWTQTDNTIKNIDLYQLTLDGAGNYIYGGQAVPLTHTTDTIQVLQPNGGEQPLTFDIYASVHGPVVAQSGDGKTALAIRVAGLDKPSYVTQAFHRMEAQTLGEFQAAEQMDQIPFFNVIYADDGGNIFYEFTGAQPVRNGGAWGDYFGILDGTDPSKLWTRTVGYPALPNAVNPPGGFVANGNNPPWTSAFPQPGSLDPRRYPAYYAPNFMDFRAQHGALFLLSQSKFTVDDILRGKESTHELLADRVLPWLVPAAYESGDPTAAAAASILAKWDASLDVLSDADGTADADQVGALLFEQFWVFVTDAVAAGKLPADTSDNFYHAHPQFLVPWSPNAALATPFGLANPSHLVPYLVQAYQALQNFVPQAGGPAAPWGAAHRTVLAYRDGQQQNVTGIAANVPESGAGDDYGNLRVTFPYYYAPLNADISFGGDSYVQLVEFTPKGPNARTLIGYGNASRPNSPHVTDQLPFFQSKTLRTTPRSLAEVEGATVSIETY